MGAAVRKCFGHDSACPFSLCRHFRPARLFWLFQPLCRRFETGSPARGVRRLEPGRCVRRLEPGRCVRRLEPGRCVRGARLAKRTKGPANNNSVHAGKRGDSGPAAPRPFGGLALSPVTLAALERAGYLEPTPVQAGVIPRALAGADVMAQAQTGTGKTAAFVIPILEGLEPPHSKAGPRGVVLVPTRELAVQVRDEFTKLALGRRTQIVAVYGGKPIRRQIEQLRAGADVVVGTPGRVLDLLDRTALPLAQVRIVVLDEADRMLDIGFRPDIEKILRRCPDRRQTLLFSATIPPPVRRLAERYMHAPEVLDFSPKELAVETIDQYYFTIDAEDKFELLVALLRREKPQQAIVFCRTKRGTQKVFERLQRRFDAVGVIHGDLPQRMRDRVMAQFRQGTIRVLVATDVVGRGIDVTRISHIINYDIPEFCDDYVHRVGRTGRMGREGVAYTFVTPEEGPELTRIEMRINRLLQRREVRELLPDYVPRPRLEAVAPAHVAAASGLGSPAPGAPAPAAGAAAPGTAGRPAAGRATPMPPVRKPVFGRPVRRIRRAL